MATLPPYLRASHQGHPLDGGPSAKGPTARTAQALTITHHHDQQSASANHLFFDAHLLACGLLSSRAMKSYWGGKRAFVVHQLIIICLFIPLLVAQSGCALPRPRLLPPPASEQVRAQLGTIGVVSAQFMPEGNLEGPTSGKGSGAAKGAGAGFLGSIGGGAYSGNPIGLAAGIALSPLAAAVGAVVGAVVAEPAATVEATEATLKKAIADLKIQETMRDRVVQVGKEQTPHPFLILQEHGPTALDQEVSYRSLASEGIDTILELRVLSLGLVGQGINPLLTLVMTVRARLIRVADGTVLYDHDRPFEYWSGERKFTDWGVNNAQPLRDEVARGYQLFAENIVEELFLLYVSFKIESWSA